MDLQHINVKVFFRFPRNVDLKDFLQIFNGWIQRHVSDELLIDVADYAHVHNGPGVLLIGHEVNYSIDNTGGRLGLLYNRKAPVQGTNVEKLALALKAALTAAQRIEKENKLKFSANEVQLIINDRLVAPNTEDTLAELFPDFKAVFDQLFSGSTYEIAQDTNPRERFSVLVKTPGNLPGKFDVNGLLANVTEEVISN